MTKDDLGLLNMEINDTMARRFWTDGMQWARSRLLFGAGAYDAVTFIGMAVLLVALAASYIPARRAVRVDPIVALRCE